MAATNQCLLISSVFEAERPASAAHQAVLINHSDESVHMQVPQDVREARRDELVSLQQHVGEGFAESLVGRQVRRL